MVTNFQFSLNGVIILRLHMRPVVINGSTDCWQLVACMKSSASSRLTIMKGLLILRCPDSS